MTARWRTVVLFLALLVAKIVETVRAVGTNIDGGYYTDIAEHVRDGDGLVSDVSLYHAGVPSFPYPTPIYPLWPWLLGVLARVVDIGILIHWLPAVLYAASLVGAFLLGRTLFPRAWWGGWHGGHLLALMLGLHREYFVYTSLPYTEGLAMTLLMFALWRVVRAPETWGSAVELGVWMSLLVLTRSQLLIVPIAAAMAFGVRALRGDAGRTIGRAVIALGIVAGVLCAWWMRNRGIVADSGLSSILRFDQARVTKVLSPVRVLYPTHGAIDFVLDRLRGVAVAYDALNWRQSYAYGFHTFHWALPVALIWAAIELGRRRFRIAGDPFAVAFLGFLSLGALLSVHLSHKVYFGEWYFHRRHAVPCVLAFFLALAYLLGSSARWTRGVGLAIVASSTVLGAYAIGDEIRTVWTAPRQDPNDAVVAWLDARLAKEGPIVAAVAAFTPTELAWRTDGVGYHWFYKRTSLKDLETMFDRLGAEYLIFRNDKTKQWRFRKDGFDAAFVRLPDEPGGFAVYRRRTAAENKGVTPTGFEPVSPR